MFIIITGATGTGKSAVAVLLAKKTGGEIISADSMQVYRGMDIGTNKITKDEMQGVPHHLIDIIESSENFSAAQFKKEAEKLMDEIKSRGKTPVICGGTGLYISAVINGIMKADEPDEETRIRIRKEYEEKGLAHMAGLLSEKDPEAAAETDLKNSRRIIRALELIEANGVKLSELKAGTKGTAYKDGYKMFILELPRRELYARIDARVDKMIEKGLVNEAKSIAAGAGFFSTAMQAIGYKEILAYGGRDPRDPGPMVFKDVVEEIKQATRNYAKRQVTWFKKYRDAARIDVSGKTAEEAAELISQKLKV
jgi:tRNA dimethylallyltransferase